MDHFVKLDRLPQGLEFPPELTDRIHYDPKRKALVFHGPMSKATYDKLSKQSVDGEYRRAIEKLFCQATYVAETTKRDHWTWTFVLAGIILVVAVAALLIWYFSTAA